MALKHVTAQDFREEVLESEVPVVVDFHAEWCGPCHQVAPVLEQLAQEWGQAVKLVKVDVDLETEIAGAYRISTIPAILLFRNGEVSGWSLGAKPGYVIEKELGIKAPAREDGKRGGLLSGLRSWWRST